MENLKTPDITPAQVIAAITFIVAQIVARGLMDNETGQLVVQIAGAVVPVAWMVADAIIRHGRANAKATVEAAKLHTTHRH